jgi:hypothetical protein
LSNLPFIIEELLRDFIAKGEFPIEIYCLIAPGGQLLAANLFVLENITGTSGTVFVTSVNKSN